MFSFEDPVERMQRSRIMSATRSGIQEKVHGTVMDLGCGAELIYGDFTIGVDAYCPLVGEARSVFYNYDVMSPDFFKQEFTKYEIDYVTMNALVCNLLYYEGEGFEVNLEKIIAIINESRRIAKEHVLIGEGVFTMNLLLEHFPDAGVCEVSSPENTIEYFKKAYIISL